VRRTERIQPNSTATATERRDSRQIDRKIVNNSVEQVTI
jgi:hypothetical protein